MRGHRAVAARARRLHQPAAFADEADAVGELSAPAATMAEYWPIEWPAAKAGCGARRAVGGPALAQRREDTRSRSRAAPAGRSRSGRGARRARPRRAALIGSPRAASAAAKTAAAAGEARRAPGPCRPTGSPGRGRRRQSWSSTPGHAWRGVRGGLVTRRRRAVHGCMHPALAVPSRHVRGRRVPATRTPADPPAAPRRAIARRFEADLSAPGPGGRRPGSRTSARSRERVAMGRALWRELVVGFAVAARRAPARVHPARGAVRPGRRQHDDRRRARRGARPLAVRDEPARRRARPAPARRAPPGGAEDRRQRSLCADPARPGRSCASSTAAARTSSSSAVRPLPPAERALVAMGVAALATRAISRRGRLIKAPRD